MQNYVYPVFTTGRVLKKESIENIRDFPRDLLDVFYADYSDGIICGFDVTYNARKLYISGGALKNDGKIIVLKDASCDFNEFGENIWVRLRLGETQETEDFLTVGVEIKITRDSGAAANEIELARFRLAEGALLRKKNEYRGVSDFITRDNTLNLVHVKYSGLYSPTFSPVLMKVFAKEILRVSQDGADIAFAFICLNGNIVHKDCIVQYLNNRLNAAFGENISNAEIYEALIDVTRKQNAAPVKRKIGGPSISG